MCAVYIPSAYDTHLSWVDLYGFKKPSEMSIRSELELEHLLALRILHAQQRSSVLGVADTSAWLQDPWIAALSQRCGYESDY